MKEFQASDFLTNLEFVYVIIYQILFFECLCIVHVHKSVGIVVRLTRGHKSGPERRVHMASLMFHVFKDWVSVCGLCTLVSKG